MQSARWMEVPTTRLGDRLAPGRIPEPIAFAAYPRSAFANLGKMPDLDTCVVTSITSKAKVVYLILHEFEPQW